MADEDEADTLVHAIASDWGTAPLAEADRALCAFAVKLTSRQNEMTQEDLEKLRGLGFDDRAIHDTVQVIGYFNYITRVADGLGVEAEDFIKPWGGDRYSRARKEGQ